MNKRKLSHSANGFPVLAARGARELGPCDDLRRPKSRQPLSRDGGPRLSRDGGPRLNPKLDLNPKLKCHTRETKNGSIPGHLLYQHPDHIFDLALPPTASILPYITAHTHTRTRTHARTHARARARARTHTHTHVCVCVCVYVLYQIYDLALPPTASTSTASILRYFT